MLTVFLTVSDWQFLVISSNGSSSSSSSSSRSNTSAIQGLIAFLTFSRFSKVAKNSYLYRYVLKIIKKTVTFIDTFKTSSKITPHYTKKSPYRFPGIDRIGRDSLTSSWSSPSLSRSSPSMSSQAASQSPSPRICYESLGQTIHSATLLQIILVFWWFFKSMYKSNCFLLLFKIDWNCLRSYYNYYNYYTYYYYYNYYYWFGATFCYSCSVTSASTATTRTVQWSLLLGSLLLGWEFSWGHRRLLRDSCRYT